MATVTQDGSQTVEEIEDDSLRFVQAVGTQIATDASPSSEERFLD